MELGLSNPEEEFNLLHYGGIQSFPSLGPRGRPLSPGLGLREDPQHFYPRNLDQHPYLSASSVNLYLLHTDTEFVVRFD